MNNRRLKELFILVKENLIQDKSVSGICAVILYLKIEKIITLDEARSLENYLYDNKPNKFNQFERFTEHRAWNVTNIDKKGYVYWWVEMYVDFDSKQIRIDFLDALITKLSTKLDSKIKIKKMVRKPKNIILYEN